MQALLNEITHLPDKSAGTERETGKQCSFSLLSFLLTEKRSLILTKFWQNKKQWTHDVS